MLKRRLVLIFTCLAVHAANIPHMPKDVWQRLQLDIQRKAMNQWRGSPMDEKGEWSQWLFASPKKKSMQDQSAAGLKEASQDPFWSPIVPDVEVKSYFDDAYVNDTSSSSKIQSPTPQTPTFRLPTPLQTISEESDDATVGKGKGRAENIEIERPFPCDVCGWRAKRMEHLKRHVNSKHLKDRPYQCGVCWKCFSRRDNFETHLKIHTRSQ